MSLCERLVIIIIVYSIIVIERLQFNSWVVEFVRGVCRFHILKES